jgi:DNA-binding HxlR family transcriptional regulator
MADQPHVALCPRYHQAVELLGRRWAGAIVRLLLEGPRRYNGLRAAIPDISDRMLAERLRELEGEGVLTRRVVPESPVRVEYELTDKGRALEAAIEAIGKWAERWIGASAGSRGTAARPRAAPTSAGSARSAARRRA